MQLCNRARLSAALHLPSSTGAQLQFMARDKHEKGKAAPKPGTAAPREPDWTAGLKQLYDSVVEEPLPEAFKDLLRKLDAAD